MLENYPYCPTLHARVAEIKALSQLPSATKDRIFPLIVARPWPNAKLMERTWQKIGEALGQRRFGLDLDPSRRILDTTKAISVEYNALFSTLRGFQNYYEAVERIPNAIPVLRLLDGDALHFEAQARHIDRIDRGLILRVQYGSSGASVSVIDRVLERFEDVSIFIDAGWTRDLLGREAWASSVVGHVSREYPEIEMVISGSSFPSSFVDVGERGVLRVEERYLYDSLVRRHNAASLIYGDWASTRPPADPVPMKNIPRIDLPTQSAWICFRRDKDIDEDEDYSQIAARVVSDPEWPKSLGIWGTFTIEWTASGEPGAIRGPAAAAAARINIHLHRQAFFGANATPTDGDEPFEDD